MWCTALVFIVDSPAFNDKDCAAVGSMVQEWCVSEKSWTLNPKSSITSRGIISQQQQPVPMDVGALTTQVCSLQKVITGLKGSKGRGKKGHAPNYTSNYTSNYANNNGFTSYNNKGYKGKSKKGFKGKGKGKQVGKSWLPEKAKLGEDMGFRGYCGGCFQYGHKRKHCPNGDKMVQGMTGSSSTGSCSPSMSSLPSTPAASVCGLCVGMQPNEWYDDDGEGNCVGHDWPPPTAEEWKAIEDQ